MIKINYTSPLIYNPNQVITPSDSDKTMTLLLQNIITHQNIISGISCIPGAIIASPSIPEDPETDQNYVYDWTRDSAMAMIEVIELFKKTNDNYLRQLIFNYVKFVDKVQSCRDVELGYARWNLDATPSMDWTIQNDGPALRALTLMEASNILNENNFCTTANKCIVTDIKYILDVYKNETVNIWEEEFGSHFYEKSIMRKAFKKFLKHKSNAHSNDQNLHEAIEYLENKMNLHWIDSKNYYKSQLNTNTAKGNDVNLSVVFAMLYGDIDGDEYYSLASERGMNTIKKIILTYYNYFPINDADLRQRGIGPNIGRYPLDTYDGDVSDQDEDFAHPWFICTNAVGSAFYLISSRAKISKQILNLAKSIFSDLYRIDDYTDIQHIGNRFILATKMHWMNGHMSEQYDRNNGFMKSVRDLTWSYASFLMCTRFYNTSQND